MQREIKSSGSWILAVAMSFTLTACGQPERPRTVSDFCLNDRALTAEPAPSPGVDDPGNRFDTDETFKQVLTHNAVHERLCP